MPKTSQLALHVCLRVGGAIIHPNLADVNKKMQYMKNRDYILPHLNAWGEKKNGKTLYTQIIFPTEDAKLIK